ncbi:MAG TPA: methyl-accepting chemotaxis protein, partial [Symbiobacteriaceae bacterium]|nr:methyl-accepting chemotaxis protein [Symbiobacteriaceae bacterium]
SRMLRPVDRVIAAAERAAGGDLGVAVAEDGAPELAQLGRATRGLIEGLRASMTGLQSVSREITAASQNMQATVDETSRLSRAVDQAAGQLDAAQDEMVKSAIATVGGFHAAVEQVARAASDQAEQVQRSHGAVDHLIRSADQVARVVG